MATSCAHYFKETLRGAERYGLKVDYLLQQSGLSKEELNTPGWRGPSEKLAHLVQQVWLTLDDEFMGFTQHRCKPGTFAMMCHLIIHEVSIGRALSKGILYYNLFTDDIRMQLIEVEKGDQLIFEVVFARPDLDPHNYFLEFWLSIWYRLICWLAGRKIPIQEARFHYSRPDDRVEEFRYMFPTTHLFDQQVTRFVFSRELLTTPIVRSKPELKSMLALAPLGFMVVPSDESSYGRKIRSYVLATKSSQLSFPQFEHMAEVLGLSPQTLRRRLKEEGTSFRNVVEGIRRDVAIQHLVRTRQPVARISEIVGYSETRAFTRAFHTWTGMSPRTYRKTFLERTRHE
ncbi:AraC family transcriptional regulator [Alcaligenaceae bacterium]|nr:AraC family transcriptional regulator [Alcaligenaceae bacterium]